MASSNTDDDTNDHQKRTVGDELYLVHLNRQKHPFENEEEDDHDYEVPPRKRSRSVGEELWDIYLKRSEGIEPDTDSDHHNNEGPAEQQSMGSPKEKDESEPTAVAETGGVMHLRNRDVPIIH